MVVEELSSEARVKITEKGKLLNSRVRLFPFIRFVSLIASLNNGERTFGDLQKFNKKHLAPHLKSMVEKGYVTIHPPTKTGKSTTDDLVEELTALSAVKNGRYDGVIKKAKQGWYHDLKSSSDWPKELLLNDLALFYELGELIARVRAGEFNEAPVKSKTA